MSGKHVDRLVSESLDEHSRRLDAAEQRIKAGKFATLGHLREAVGHVRSELRRHEIGRKLSEAIAEADASGEPIPMTGPQLTERLRKVVRDHRATGKAGFDH